MAQLNYKAADDPNRLKKLVDAGFTNRQIGKQFGISERTVQRRLSEYEIERKVGRGKKDYAGYTFCNSSRPAWRDNNSTVYIHQLLAISEGADPYKIFSGGDYHVHHKNGIPWDNRPENIEVLSNSEHVSLHADQRGFGGGGKEYTEEEMLEWIELFVVEFGFVPTSKDIIGWPGPSYTTYSDRFGTFTEAVRKAGLTPRGADE